ncbi:hypothetical protein [Microbispora hainanensis]|uniref:Uncharacterized protein n=1 Tax=Microbispora hainanensis TaxID=568844 RepID=A0A544Z5C2_9ACTN|nr:hypothetical protein [Microbispora hainanensis]TQS24243.1 hypothetical protein FLX08_00630 [Microbispora hainanensis]
MVIHHALGDNRIIAFVDESQFAPELIAPMDEVGTATLKLLQPVEDARPMPALRVRIRRSGDLGHELVVAEYATEELTVAVEKTLITEELAAVLGYAGTTVTRAFVRRTT